MKTEIVAKNYRVSDRLEQILNAKMNKLNKYFPEDAARAKIVLSENGKQSKMEVSVYYEGMQIRAESVNKTMYYCVDDCLPKVERQIVKHREKLGRKRKLPAVGSDYEFVSAVEDEGNEIITKVKQFAIDRMSAQDAAESLDMVGHDFYLFVNEENGNVEAVYRRKDGTVGLLKPYEEN